MKLLSIVFFLISSVCVGQEAGKEKQVVLFVCEHGAARSLVASAYFNKLAAEKGLEYTSVFRGAQPDSVLNPAAVEGLRKDGMTIPDQGPVPVSASDRQRATRTITFDCTIPVESKRPQENWASIPLVGKDYEKARDEILKRVQALIAALENEKVGKK